MVFNSSLKLCFDKICPSKKKYIIIYTYVFRRVPHIVPGRYGYGRAPHVAPLLVDSDRGSASPRLHRQRRSAAANSLQHVTGGHNDFQSFKLDASNNPHHLTRPYVHPRTQHHRNNQVWASLYQPTSANQAEVQTGSQTSSHHLHKERPYNPLPSSFCTGEHAHYKICNSNVCMSAISQLSG